MVGVVEGEQGVSFGLVFGLVVDGVLGQMDLI